MDFVRPGLPRRLWAQDAFVSSVRVFVALSAAVALCWWSDHMPLLVPLLLGIIASALAETDDNWRGRLRALLVTLGCFAVAAFSVQALIDRPWLFVAGLGLSTFGLTMLGAISDRYRTISWATVILAIYTMLNVSPHGGGVGAFWEVPALLLTGALWYGLLSVLWCALFPYQPVRRNLAGLYEALGAYLRLKASLFEPVRGVDVERRRLGLAQLNAGVVGALNKAKESLFVRMEGQPRPSARLARLLHLYFAAQDIHERASSSHYHYNELADRFFHSDVLYRCQRVLGLQGLACSGLARALQEGREFRREDEAAQAMADLHASIAHLLQQGRPEWERPLRSLQGLERNLATLDVQLAAASDPQSAPQGDISLFDRSPQSLREAAARVRQQLTPTAPRFRHALRLALALAAGYGVMRAMHADGSYGYWILLTTLFVCQQNYGATLQRVGQRILGTALGLVAGWALLGLFPSLGMQALFAVAAGVAFFATRATRYTLGTASITLLVLMCFNQTGNGYDLILPRLLDTLIGSVIAALAVLLVLPDWQGRRLHLLAAQAVAASADYLRVIVGQYASGKRDDLAYRLARRNAHNADAAFSGALQRMLQEPGPVRLHAGSGMRLLVLSHTLLSYLSTLGAHRPQAPERDDAMVASATGVVADALASIAQALRNRTEAVVPETALAAQAEALEQAQAALDEPGRLVHTQLAQIIRQLGPLARTADELVRAARRP